MITPRSSAALVAGVCRSLWCAARCNRLPVRSSSSVNTWRVPALKAILETQPKLAWLHTTTAGSALPMKYSISPAW
ncbi:hypothetical protein D9M69_690960 [compost metagenome]